MGPAGKILRDVCGLLLASALAFVPVAAVHAQAQAHPLASTGETESAAAEGSAASSHAEAADPSSQAVQAGASSAQGGPAGAEVPQVDSGVDAQALSSYYLANGDFITSVKLQDPWGACWAFAIAAAVESSILEAQAKLDGTYAQRVQQAADAAAPKLTGLGGVVDVSERAIAWLAHEVQDEASAGDQAGEGLYRVDPGDATTQLAGGNFSIVEAALAARQGLLSEGAAPYQYNGYASGSAPWYSSGGNGGDARMRDWSLNNALRTVNDLGWYVSGIIELESPAAADYDFGNGVLRYTGYDEAATQRIKQTLVDVGAVAISLQAETSLPGQVRSTSHFDYATWSQYDASSTILTNHAVSIVGWDDAYSASNFTGTQSGQPPADGAWLCKNNWGSDGLFAALGGTADTTGWGISDEGAASGFFWLSYYDHTITTPVAFEVSPTDAAHSTLYQHDYLGISEYSEPSSYVGAVRVANVFTAEKTELLKTITAQTFHQDETVRCWIYTLPAGYDPAEAEAIYTQAGGGDAAAEATEVDGAAANGGEGNGLSADPAAQTVIHSEQVGIELEDRGPTGNGTLAATLECTFQNAGFHEIELDTPVLIATGQSFAIVQQVQANVPIEGGAEGEASYLNLELAFDDAPAGAEGVETMARAVSNPGETFVSLSSEWWMPLADFNEWYDAAQGGSSGITFGNALIKAQTDNTSMSAGDQVYELVNLTTP